MRSTGAIACALAISTGAALIAAPEAPAGSTAGPADPSTSDVCILVPGSDVATATGGRLVETMLVRPDGRFARCRYTVSVGAGDRERRDVYVVWLHSAVDFDDLRKHQDDPVEPVARLGDEAFVSFHPDSERHDLFVLLRGIAAVEVTAPTAAGARAVAETSLAALRRAAARR